jgi:AmmeMemoRadiSam system protein B
MSKKIFTLIAATLCISLGLKSFFFSHSEVSPKKSSPRPEVLASKDEVQTETHSATTFSHPSIFFDKIEFEKAVHLYPKQEVSPEVPSKEKNIRGGIVPHHLLVSHFIAHFFSQISTQHIKTVILIGPNHPEAGTFPVLSSFGSWQTAYGTVQTNSQVLQNLVDRNLVKIDDQVLTQEHSVAGLMPFIRYYLPDSTVVPIIVSKKMALPEQEKLSQAIFSQLDSSTIVIASIDFSHNLPNLEAQQRDQKTITLMQKHEYEKLRTLNSEYLDSPPSLITLFKVMAATSTDSFTILDHSNSGQYLKDDTIPTTSYFVVTFP